MRGSCWLNRRIEQRFRLLAISTVKSVKIKLLLLCCVALTLLAFSTTGSTFLLWNNQTPLRRFPDSRFVIFIIFVLFTFSIISSLILFTLPASFIVSILGLR